MDAAEMALLAGGGFAAGVINTLAGGGSLITVGLLVFLGLPGTIANGTNRIGVLVHNLTAAWRFRVEGISGFGQAAPILAPALLGSVIGAYAISRVTPELFERLFGALMLALLIPLLRPRRSGAPANSAASSGDSAWSPLTRSLVFFAIGLYAGALQAGIGIFLVMALSRAGYDLVRANSIKVVVIAALTAVAIPVFIASRQVDWLAAGALTAGFVLGGIVGVRLAVLGGESVIRAVLGLSVAALAGRMLGLF
jgi:hypothetical protein